jgi:hypothetical protein
VADLAVTCSPYRRGEQLVKDPILIVEILSPGTGRHDRQVKVPAYRDIGSVNEILLSIRKAFTPRYSGGKAAAGSPSWFSGETRPFASPRSICRSPMAELYDGIDIEAENAA